MRKPKSITTNVTELHPLDQQTQNELLDAYIHATARYVKAMGFAKDEWRVIQIWARKTKHGYSNDIRVSVNGEYMGEALRPEK
jgi:hypothetical protein